MTDQHLRPGPTEQQPIESAIPSAPEVMGNPWEQRARLGWWRAVFENSKLFLLHPVRGFALTRHRGGFRGPFLFALVVLVAGTFATEFSQSIYDVVVGDGGSGTLEDLFHLEVGDEPVLDTWWLPAGFLGLAGFAGCLIGLVLGIPVFMLILPVVLLLWGGTLHLCLWLVRGLQSSDSGFEGTWGAICYSAPAFLLGAIPAIGGAFVIVGLGLLQAIGLRQMHRTSTRRALLALILPILVALAALAVYLVAGPGGS